MAGEDVSRLRCTATIVSEHSPPIGIFVAHFLAQALEMFIAARPDRGRVTGSRKRHGPSGIQRNRGYERAVKRPAKEKKKMKKNVVAIALALATTLALSQSVALAKSSKTSTTKSASAKKHHKKHMYKPK